MAITPLRYPTPADVVAEARASLGSLSGVLWSARTSEEMVAGVEELQRLKARAAALEARLVAELDARQAPKRELSWASTSDWYAHTAGTTRGRARRTVEHARVLTGPMTATLEALEDGSTSPEQADVVVTAVEKLPTAQHVRRRGEQLMLEEAGRLNASDLHRTGRHLAHVIDPDHTDREDERALDRQERAAHLGRFLTVTDDGAGGIRVKGRGSVEDGATLRAALLPLTKPEPPADGCESDTDLRDHGARMWDALVQTAQHALDSDLPPSSHGARPRIAVTITADHLARASGAGATDDGLELPAGAVHRLACDADLIRVVLDPDGCVLDVGRTRRLVTPAIWTALVARDHHCAFPGCTRPPVMCHAHHIRHWTHGGPTSLPNLVLVCGHHHRTLHHTPWQVRLAADGRPEFLPPAKHGQPPSEWLRHRRRLE